MNASHVLIVILHVTLKRVFWLEARTQNGRYRQFITWPNSAKLKILKIDLKKIISKTKFVFKNTIALVYEGFTLKKKNRFNI